MKIKFFVILCIAVLFCGEKINAQHSSYQIYGSDELYIKYKPIYQSDALAENNYIELVYVPATENKKGRLYLRIKLTEYPTESEKNMAMYIMIKEVTTLTSLSASKGIRLDNSDYTLYFAGGYPVWGPFGQGGRGNYQCLLFSNNVVIKDKKIFVQGEPFKSKYYGYPSEAGFSPPTQ